MHSRKKLTTFHKQANFIAIYAVVFCRYVVISKMKMLSFSFHFVVANLDSETTFLTGLSWPFSIQLSFFI